MRKMLSRPGCDLVYEVSYHPGAPAVVLLHGYGVHRAMWQPQYERLQESYTVINLDVRGHGESRPAASFSMAEAADDLHALLQKEDCPHAALVGLSMGGYIVQEYAYRYGGAEAYVCIGATPLFLPCYSKGEMLALKHSAFLFYLYPWGYLKRLMARTSVTSPEHQKQVAAMFDVMRRKDFIHFWGGIAHAIHAEEMSFDAPLLVLCGEKDTTGTVKKTAPCWEQAYGVKARFIPGARHIANLDGGDTFNQILWEFLASTLKKA